MKRYKTRIVDEILKDKLEAVDAILIEGPKACGKTTTAEHHSKSILYLDDPIRVEQNLQMVQTNIKILLKGEYPRLIDEWQLAPELWDAIRFEVDHSADRKFILTGSAVPADISKINHSGAGRFGWLTMRPMTLWESGESTGEVSLKKLFEDKEKNEIEGRNLLSLRDIAFFVCRGGWPGSLDKTTNKGALLLVQEYYQAIVRSDISRIDNIARDPERTQKLMRVYARHLGSQAGVPTILKDLLANETYGMSDVTIESYLNALRKIFVIEDMLAWNPNLRSKVAVRTTNTRYFVDPSIAVASLGIGPEDLINDLHTFGFLFETLVVRDLRVYADSIGGSVYHYKDANGLECDAVIHLKNGNYGLIEIKIGGQTLIDKGVETLNKIESKIDTVKMKAPSFKMIITAVGDYAFKRKDGIFVVPIGCLKN